MRKMRLLITDNIDESGLFPLRIILCKLKNMHKNQMWELQLEPASVSVVECSEIKIVFFE